MDKELVFLVVLDNSDEVLNALRYASQRSSINNGRVALLYTFETLEFSHWKFTQKNPKKYIMKGDRVECIINFLEANKFITNFVLAASSKDSGSDPLINAFTGKQRSKISVPLTIIPPNLSEEEIDKLS